MALTHIVLGGTTYRLLFPELLPRPTQEDQDRLEDSIRQVGVQNPVDVVHDNPEPGVVGVIDGITRLHLCLKLKITDVPLRFHDGLTEGEMRALCISRNVPRRHLTPEQFGTLRQERVVRMFSAYRAGKSVAALAREEGIREDTVRYEIEQAKQAEQEIEELPEPQEETEEPKQLKKPPSAKDRLARFRKKAVPEFYELLTQEFDFPLDLADRVVELPPEWQADYLREWHATGRPSPHTIYGNVKKRMRRQEQGERDGAGFIVPEEMDTVWAARITYKQARDLIFDLQELLCTLARSPGGVYLPQALGLSRSERPLVDGSVEEEFRLKALDDLRKDLDRHLPFVVGTEGFGCPYCADENNGCLLPSCKACHGKGWVTKAVWDGCPEKKRNVLLRQLGAQPKE